jgi:hypothetical protein
VLERCAQDVVERVLSLAERLEDRGDLLALPRDGGEVLGLRADVRAFAAPRLGVRRALRGGVAIIRATNRLTLLPMRINLSYSRGR